MGQEFYIDNGWDELGYAFPLIDATPGTEREVGLWCQVIVQTLMDFCDENPNMTSERNAAVFWLLRDRKDFFLICSLASVNPSIIRHVAQEAYYNQEAMEKLKRNCFSSGGSRAKRYQEWKVKKAAGLTRPYSRRKTIKTIGG